MCRPKQNDQPRADIHTASQETQLASVVLRDTSKPVSGTSAQSSSPAVCELVSARAGRPVFVQDKMDGLTLDGIDRSDTA